MQIFCDSRVNLQVAIYRWIESLRYGSNRKKNFSILPDDHCQDIPRKNHSRTDLCFSRAHRQKAASVIGYYEPCIKLSVSGLKPCVIHSSWKTGYNAEMILSGGNAELRRPADFT